MRGGGREEPEGSRVKKKKGTPGIRPRLKSANATTSKKISPRINYLAAARLKKASVYIFELANCDSLSAGEGEGKRKKLFLPSFSSTSLFRLGVSLCGKWKWGANFFFFLASA